MGTDEAGTREDLRRLLKATLDAIPDIIGIQDLDHRIIRYNAAGYRYFQLDPEEVAGRRCYELMGWKKPCRDCATSVAIQTREPAQLEKYVPELECWLEVRAYPLLDDDGRVYQVIEHLRDITDRKRAEKQQRELEASIQQAQKLESLGLLAGGVAHDFNNLLVGILGNASLALETLGPNVPGGELIREIESAALRAAELVQQLLVYAGRGDVELQPVDLNVTVQEVRRLLQTSVSKKAELRYELDSSLPAVDADPSQVRQVVMNLLTNASDALGDQSGVITLTTGVVECDRETLQQQTFAAEDAPAGTFCLLRVRDTGVGLDAEAKVKLFEPFFSTKATGRGLGLAAVLGVVRRHRGAIDVQSRPGDTTFTVLLPRGRGTAGRTRAAADGAGWRGGGTVLVVDDEVLVQRSAARMLERMGFEVVVAEDGAEALELLRAAPDRFVLVLLDLTMPRMGGMECLEQLHGIRPELPVLLSSGFREPEADAVVSASGPAGFIHKPYRYHELRSRIAQLLVHGTPAADQ